MASLNKVMLIGNLTRDPEVRYTPKGTAVSDIGLAVNRVYSGEGGDKREETTFVDVVMWGRQAELAGQYLKKGRPLFVEGRLQLDTWEDKNTGQKRSKMRVVCENMQFLGSPRDGDGGGGGGGGYRGGGGGGSDQQQQSSAPQAGESSGGGGGGGGAPGGGPAGSGGGGPSFDDEEDDVPF